MSEIYRFQEHDLIIEGAESDLLYIAALLHDAEGTVGDLRYQIEYAFDIDDVRSNNVGTEDAEDPNYALNYLVKRKVAPVNQNERLSALTLL